MGLGNRNRRGRKPDEDESEANEQGWVRVVIERFPRPQHPLTEDWEISVAALLRQIPGIPAFATKPLGLLDRMGAVHLGMEKVGFDGHEVAWDKVVEIRTRDTVVLLNDQLIEEEVGRWRKYLPPVPGRGWVVGKVGELLLTLVLAVISARSTILTRAAIEAELAEAETERAAAHVVDTPDGQVSTRVPAEIVYRTTLRGNRTTEVSLVSMLLLQAVPASTSVLLDTARAKGISVVDVPALESDFVKAAERADAIVARLRAFRQE